VLRRVGTLPFLVEHHDGQTTLAVEGEIDAANIDAFEAILDVVAKADTDTLVVDLSHLKFMDVRGINAMVRSRTAIESLGGSFVLRRPPAPVRRILEVLMPDMPVEPKLPADPVGSAPGQDAHRRQAPDAPPTVQRAIELTGTCGEGWEQAVAAVVARASQGIGDLRAELAELDVHIENGPVATYRAKVKLSFPHKPDAS
jgi:anti-anti-sigma factor